MGEDALADLEVLFGPPPAPPTGFFLQQQTATVTNNTIKIDPNIGEKTAPGGQVA